MSNTAISVENLGKNYIIGHKKEGDFRHAVGNKLKNIFKPDASEKEVFWALKDINFEIKHGEAVGIIGRNGAGKSTLLKILSRITDPSTGRFEINGRVSSLLEVGTGFHAELSGRENIYLNGTILGMKRAEIRQKFDEIVDFSGVEKFLDTPVKHYSSGMKVRLAFSVAAHLEPEILIVDEVLAVGDAEFQKKCLGKMDQVSKNEGRTVLFVSHNMVAVNQLCSKGILLNSGRLNMVGSMNDIIKQYINSNDEGGLTIWKNHNFNKDIPIDLKSAGTSLEGKQPNLKLDINLSVQSNKYHSKCFLAFDILNEMDSAIFQSIPIEKGFISPSMSEKHFTFRVHLPALIPGRYFVSVWLGSNYTETIFWHKNILSFDVNDSPIEGRTMQHSKSNGSLICNSEMI
ncbi:ABC transporter ATP-binding protein [Marivirga arenosa]|uniref:ABC transporter ATP-binding protein n=1 Tax=Marivirga arenosa TaxID=3059076 RepID=A0AA49JHT4_9BACT|nr:ABC transporter ATP-binding protein [Marivirga sp. BKB1-2]WKK82570.2 ABC transporter ATP-binding protein [Marivirga sp. BKB1-2]